MTAIIFGATGGLGRALIHDILLRGEHGAVFAVSRSGADIPGAHALKADFTNESHLFRITETVAPLGPVTLCFVASGLLSNADVQPEKTFRTQSLSAFETVFAANTFGPALIAKHMLPLLPKDQRSVFACLSARVGSISDNQLGGWHAYRASKAALNMLLKNYALEMARRAPQAIILGLHPGTVDTDLSKPFQSGVASEKLFTPAQSATYLLDVIAARTPEDSGKIFDWAGKEIPA